MNLYNEARRLLESSKYRTFPGPNEQTFFFEDASLVGFVWIADTTATLIEQWERKQSDFLHQKDRQLRQSKEKSWNVYSVLLSGPEPTEPELSKLHKIEEDFRATRKIAKSGIRTLSHLTLALLPLLIIQSLVQLERDDSQERLRERLSRLDRQTLDAIVGQDKPEEAARMICSHYEDSQV